MISLAVLGFAHAHVHALLSQWAEHPEYEEVLSKVQPKIKLHE